MDKQGGAEINFMRFRSSYILSLHARVTSATSLYFLSDFSDVALACDDCKQFETRKVILAISIHIQVWSHVCKVPADNAGGSVPRERDDAAGAAHCQLP